MDQHLLLVTYPAHGHINPTLHLAKRLAGIHGAAHVTFSTAVSAHRRMFPSSAAAQDMEVDDGLLSYIPFSDGYDDGVNLSSGTIDAAHVMSQLKLAGSHSLSTIVDSLSARGRPVTCIVYSLVLPWAADVALSRGIPSALFWIQPATVFAIYYRYFHGYDSLIAAHRNDPSFTVSLPGLPPLRIQDLPSFLTRDSNTDNPYFFILTAFRETFETLEREEKRPKVLVNTFEELEADAVAAVDHKVDLIPVGPLVAPSLINGDDATEEAEGEGYMEWLDSRPERSVVYVSFGTIAQLKMRQVEEIWRGLVESGRPFLWAMRKGEGIYKLEEETGESGKVVEWVSQSRVLSHRAVGCFVTHCGWNSTLESLAGGVPTVVVPQWTDQTTNARLLAEEWGTGVRGQIDGEGVLEGRELQRCLEMVMGEGEKGVEIRRRAEMLRASARYAVRDGGPSDRNLKAFVDQLKKANN